MRGLKKAAIKVDIMFPRIQTTKEKQDIMTDNNVIEFIERHIRNALSEMQWTTGGGQHLINQATLG